MKIRKRLFLLALSLCLCCSLLFCSAVETFAAGVPIPEYPPYKTGEITTQEFLDANRHEVRITVYSPMYGAMNLSYLDALSIVDRMTSKGKIGDYVNMLQFSVPDDADVYQSQIVEVFTGISELEDIDTNSYDFFVHKHGVAYEIPKSYSSSKAPTSFWIVPYYVKDGSTTLVSGETMAITTLTTREIGDYMVYQFEFTPEKAFVIATADVPEGHSLYGFGYRWAIDGAFVDGTSIYTTGMTYSLYTPSDATSTAIENMSDRISSELQEMNDQMTAEIEEMGDQISGEIDEMGDQISDELKQQTEAQKGFFQQLGDRITGGLEALGNKLLDGIKALFIPEEGFFEEYFAQWDTWMEEHFGALYYPIDLMIEILNRFLNLEVPDTPTITFPEIRVGEHLLLESQQYTFLGDDTLPAIRSLYQMYRMIVIVIFVFALAALCWKKINAIMGGGE